MSGEVVIRPGRDGDGAKILAIWDTAIAWLVARGQPQQWGVEPASARPRCREMVRDWETGDGLRIAELDGEAVGASVIGADHPDHVATVARSESYLHFLISDRACVGLGIGSALVGHAAQEARAAGSELLRVDCWAGAPSLVAWYERQGFVRSDSFTVRDSWHGQVFEMAL